MVPPTTRMAASRLVEDLTPANDNTTPGGSRRVRETQERRGESDNEPQGTGSGHGGESTMDTPDPETIDIDVLSPEELEEYERSLEAQVSVQRRKERIRDLLLEKEGKIRNVLG